jgi:UDP-N-acetylglucosamine 2-epimerase (non-hydrolysing)
MAVQSHQYVGKQDHTQMNTASKFNTILVVIGTRPEGIKLSPVIKQLQSDPRLTVLTCITGQHESLLMPILQFFNIQPDINLAVMNPNQSLAELTAKCTQRLDAYMKDAQPDLVIVQGDTTTALCGALAAYYNGVPVAHVEAGLRSHCTHLPFPEEANRRLISVLTTYHFAPTKQAQANLISENVASERIFVVGNSGIDALQMALQTISTRTEAYGLKLNKMGIDLNRKLILITCHRRESIGTPLRTICAAIQDLARDFPDIQWVYPVHANPAVVAMMKPLKRIDSIIMIPPLSYDEMVAVMSRCYCILTDSGGIQEEAPTLGKPVLVLRDVTERHEGIAAGSAVLVGTDPEKIKAEVRSLINHDVRYESMARATNPYGSGDTAAQIYRALITP